MNKNFIQNRTIFIGDNLEVMRTLNSEIVDLIYLYPPVGNPCSARPRQKNAALPVYPRCFCAAGSSPQDELFAAAEQNPAAPYQAVVKIARLLEMVEEVSGLMEAKYIYFMAVRLLEMRRLLKPEGSIYLHCNPRLPRAVQFAANFAFGQENFQHEIIWKPRMLGTDKQKEAPVGGVIFHYGKPEKILSAQKGKRDVRPFFINNAGENASSPGVHVQDIWDDIPAYKQKSELDGVIVKNPAALLKRIIKISGNKNGWLLDPFCGDAAACIAAEKLNYKWFGIDARPEAAHFVRAALSAKIKNGKPLEIYRRVIY